MGPAYYVIAIFGCADGSAACAPAATLPTRYESRAACAAVMPDALAANTDLDFPTLEAECRAVTRPASARQDKPRPFPVDSRKG